MFKLIYENHHGLGFNSERNEYEPGEPVTVTYNVIGTDMSYTFDVDAADVKVTINGSVATITFTMPEHDVEINVGSRPYMGMSTPPYMGMSMGMGLGMDSVWLCEMCGTRNTGRFCTECGRPKVLQMKDAN